MNHGGCSFLSSMSCWYWKGWGGLLRLSRRWLLVCSLWDCSCLSCQSSGSGCWTQWYFRLVWARCWGNWQIFPCLWLPAGAFEGSSRCLGVLCQFQSISSVRFLRWGVFLIRHLVDLRNFYRPPVILSLNERDFWSQVWREGSFSF